VSRPREWARRGFWSLLALGVLLPAGALHGEPAESLALMDAEPTPSDVILGEAEWAANLVDLLGLEHVLPPDHDEADLFSLLCADRAELALGAGGRRLPADATFRVTAETPRGRTPGEPVRVVLAVPATTLYQLSIEGVGFQRWVIDQQPVGHLDLSPLGVAQASAVVPLREGPHEVSGYLAPEARVDRMELAAYRPLCVAPADGWRGSRALRYGAMARTLVRAFGFDRRLPQRQDEELRIEGESFDEVSGGGGRTSRRLQESASGDSWAMAISSPAEFAWSLRLEEPRVVSLKASTHGVQPQIWSVDGRYRLTVHPQSTPAGFTWNHLITLPLGAGEHVLRALIPRGSGIDAIRVVHHRSSDADHVAVLEELGFRGGAPGAPVPRGVALNALASPSFVELANGFRLRLQGDTSDRSLALVDDEPRPLTSRPLSPLLPAEL
jgi:hypothetical protein